MSNLRLKIQKGARPGSTRARYTSAILKLKSNYRFGMTLIELLIVIVILTTLVVAVVPILSPNNDSRKIREAGRGLHSYISLAQAKAARSGRPAGIAFQESSAGSGVALEVFQLEVPKGFAGFSEESRCTIAAGFGQYGSGGNGGIRFVDQYDGAPLYGLRFVLANRTADPFPPRMFRIGDIVDVEGNQFLIVDDIDPSSPPNLLKGFPELAPPDEQTYYLEPPNVGPPVEPILCIWLNNNGQLLAEGTLKSYKIIRQPVNSTASPHQLPSGIAIDMQGSIAEGGVTAGFPIPGSLNNGRPPAVGPDSPDTVAIMFSPAGGVSDVYHNSSAITNAAKIMLLLGRVENGNLAYAPNTSKTTFADLDVNQCAWTIASGASDDELEQKQEEVNWLNLDSRWLAIAARSGRVVVNENAFIDARTYGGLDPEVQATEQIEAAHEFIHEMKRGGGR